MKNAYATLADFKAYIVARGQTASTDATDDGVIEALLEQASRYFDDQTQRVFYPFIQTRYYDVPDSRELDLDEDLLEVITLTNGDNTSLSSTEYSLIPRNYSPAYGIKIKDVSTYNWTSNSEGSLEEAITVNAIWGFHDQYSRDAWKVGTTLAEDLDTSETQFDVTSEALFSAGQIIRFGNELATVSRTSSGKIYVEARGGNGSTAATHLSGATVYIWQPMKEVKSGVLEFANTAYHRRFGRSQGAAETITAAGVVLTPRDVPATVAAFIETFKSKL